MSGKKKDVFSKVTTVERSAYEWYPLHLFTTEHFSESIWCPYATEPAFQQEMEAKIIKTRKTEETGDKMSSKKQDDRIKEVVRLLEAPLEGFDLQQIYQEALSTEGLYDHQQRKYRHDHDETQFGTIRMPAKLVLAMLQNIADFRKGFEHGFVIAEPKISDKDFNEALEKAFEDDGSPFGGRVVVREGVTVKSSKLLPHIPESLQDFASDLCTCDQENDTLNVQFTFHDDIVRGEPRNPDRKACLKVQFGSIMKNGTESTSEEIPIRYARIVKQDGKHYARFQFVKHTDASRLRSLAKQHTIIHASLRLYAGSSKKYHIDQSTPLLIFRDQYYTDLYLHVNGGAVSTHKRPERMAVRVDNKKQVITHKSSTYTTPREDLPRWLRPLYRHINERALLATPAGVSKYYVPATQDYLRLYFGTQIKCIAAVNLLTYTEVPTIQVLVDKTRSYANLGTYCTKQGHVDTLNFKFRDAEDIRYQARVKSTDIRGIGSDVGEILFEVQGVLGHKAEDEPVRVPPVPKFIKPFEGLIEPFIDRYCCAWESIDPTIVGTLTFDDQSIQRIEKVLYMDTENSERGTVKQMRIVCLPPQKTVLKKHHTSSLIFKTCRGTIVYQAEVLDSIFRSGKVETTFKLHEMSQSYYSGMASF